MQDWHESAERQIPYGINDRQKCYLLIPSLQKSARIAATSHMVPHAAVFIALPGNSHYLPIWQASMTHDTVCEWVRMSIRLFSVLVYCFLYFVVVHN